MHINNPTFDAIEINMTTPNRAVGELLDGLGLAIGAHRVEIIDFHQAEACNIHHTRVPVAVVGYASVSPSFAEGRFPKLSFLDLIAKRPSMDEDEACALAAVCGATATPPFWNNGAPFGKHLWAVIERYELGAFFERLDPDHAYGTSGEHYATRPRGADTRIEEAENEAIRGKWRADYRKLPGYRKVLVATIIRLYNTNENIWLVRVPKNWHAVEAIEMLRKAAALSDWARLYALYPGW